MTHYEEEEQARTEREQMFIDVEREFYKAIVDFEKDKDKLFGEADCEDILLYKVHFWNRKLKHVLKSLAECSFDKFDWEGVREIKIRCHGALPIEPANKDTKYHRPELIIKFFGYSRLHGYTELGNTGHIYYNANANDMPGFGTFHGGTGPKVFKNNPGMVVFMQWYVEQFPKIEAAFQELADKRNAIKQQKKDAEIKMCEDALAKLKASKNAYEWQRKVKLGWVKEELTP